MGAFYLLYQKGQLTSDNSKRSSKIELSAVNVYAAYQQGTYGIEKKYDNPASKSTGNMAEFDKQQFLKEGPFVTNAQFLQSWEERFDRLDFMQGLHKAGAAIQFPSFTPEIEGLQQLMDDSHQRIFPLDATRIVLPMYTPPRR